MKKSLSIFITVVLISLSFSVKQENDHYYYCFDQKIYLQQATDQILVKFAPGAGREQLHAIVGSDASLQETSNCYLDEGRHLRIAVLESKDGKSISPATLEYFKAEAEVISATYLFQTGSSLTGLMDEFLLMLKPSTSYAQLQEIARKNDCTVSDEDMLQKNEIT